MSIRLKILLILILSQILLVLALTTGFAFLLQSVKNIPQTQRAEDLSGNFQRELEFKEEKLKLLLEEIKSNPKISKTIENGMRSRKDFLLELSYFQSILKRYDLNIFEVGDSKGKVLFRVHRPDDFGDDKSKQPLVQKALKGITSASLEDGHSGLGFRLASPLPSGGTILIGQIVDNEFTKHISKDKRLHLAIFQGGKVKTVGSDTLATLIQENPSLLEDNQRFSYNGKPYYHVKIPYTARENTISDLVFAVLIDENEVETKTGNIWKFFFFATVILVGLIFLISFVFSHDIVQAIKKLTKAMNDLENWNPEALPNKRKDEIGQMGRVFVQMKEELFQHQFHLEDKVKQRTMELNATLAEVQSLKQKQDGDYFLTSLLIRPLKGAFSESKSIHISILERQMKEFSFKNQIAQIGGDISITDSIQLLGNNYIVFLNADAMGKSIQGAGGALVIGTVFKAILTRTQKLKYLSERHPERWLKECFQEIHNVFISFDGHMLISAVIGLVDEATGTLYFINSEHPWPVLYRDGKASFLGTHHILRKIGFTEMSGDEVVVTVQPLQPKDVVIIGSDGRDDILLSGNEEIRTINDDETLFLQHVEKGEGELNRILAEILQTGEITDDFSLLRIGYKTEVFEYCNSSSPSQRLEAGTKLIVSEDVENAIVSLELALESEPKNIFCLKELSKHNLELKNYTKSIDYLERYLKICPEDNEYLFLIAYAYKKIKNFNQACDYAERLRLRDPQNVKNLILLSEVLLHLRQFKKSKLVLNSLKIISPKNPKVEKLLTFWEKHSLQKVSIPV